MNLHQRRRAETEIAASALRYRTVADYAYDREYWPVRGNARVKEMITMARDGYRYINDQTLRLANHGYTPNEVASYDLFFDYLGMRLNGPKAAGKKITLNLVFPDTKDKYVLALENGALSQTPNAQLKDADATVTMPRTVLNDIVLGETTLEKAIEAGKVTVQGRKDSLSGWYRCWIPSISGSTSSRLRQGVH